MDAKLNDSISTTISEGLKFIQGIAKHLPEALTEQTHSVTLSFQKILRVLDEAKRMCVPELDSNYITRRSTGTSLSNAQMGPDYENLSTITGNLFSFDERKPMTLPPDTTADEYLIIQGNNNNNIRTNPHTPRIRLNITVNRKPKGMYYCLMEKGVLLLDRNINAENSEYVIPLSEYTFQAVNNFTIKLTKNELEISLLFSSMSDRNTWLSYITAARDPVYSYVTIDRCNVNTTQTPRVGLVPSLSLPIRKSRSVDTILSPNYDFVDITNISIDSAKKAYGSRLPRNNVPAPPPIPTNNHFSDPIEHATPKEGFKKFRRFIPFKQLNSAHNARRGNIKPQQPFPYLMKT